VTREKVTPQSLAAMKKRGEPIAALTAYDCPTADLLDEAGVEIILVGDSVGMAVLGLDSTLPVTLDDMVHHARAVTRRRRRAQVVADMPWLTFHTGPYDAVRNAGRLIQEGGADAVKVEGGERSAEVLAALVGAQIPVMGHVGLTPQSVLAFGGYRVQGRTAPAADRVVADARACEAAGCYSVVLEGMPPDVARRVTETLAIPTIGIGAGGGCDGQILVTHDMLGLFTAFTPKFVKRYAELAETIRHAVGEYVRDVKGHVFPGPEHAYE
jgi:3-methyl-2-oxobutanoate hydroxymethyltransferase